MFKKISSLIMSALILTTYFTTVPTQAADIETDVVAVTKESLLMAPLTEEGYLIDSLQLPTEGESGSTITWESSANDIISDKGNVTRAESENKEVTLTATFTKNGQTATEEYTFMVASLTSEAAGMPKLAKMLHADEFDDGVIDTKYISSYTAGGTVTEEDGALLVSRTKATGDLYAALNAGEEMLSGRYMLEYILEASSPNQINTRLYGNSSGTVTSVDILSNGAISYWERTSAESAGAWGTISADSSRIPRVKMSVFVDTEVQKYSMWLNNTLVIDNHYFRNDNTALSNMRLWLAGEALNSLKIKSYKVYKAKDVIIENDTEAVTYDKNALSAEKLLMAPLADGVYLLDSLSLPESGKNETTIEWSSSNESVISNKGAVIRPKDEDKEVTLTATVSRGNASATEEFTFKVASLFTENAGMPRLQSLVYADEFDDGMINEDFIKPLQTGGTVSEVDGVLMISRYSAGGDAGANFYFNKDKVGDEGRFFIEFILERTALKQVASRLFGNNSINTISLDWLTNGGFSYWKRENAEAAGVWGNTPASTTAVADMKISVYLDTESKTYSVWADNVKIIDNFYFRNEEPSAHFMRFYLTDDNHTTLKIKSLKLYRAWTDMADEDRVLKDANALSLPDILDMQDIIDGKTTAKYDLAALGMYASNITWQSSNTDVISADGVICRQAGDGTDRVVLTAVVSYGAAQTQKEFEIYVPQTGISVSDKPAVKEMIVENDFSRDMSDVHAIALGGTTSTDRYEYKDGKLEAERLSTNSNQTYVSLSPYKYYSDDYVVRGTVGVELTIGRKAEQTMAIRFKGIGGDDYLALTWFYGGWITLTHQNAPGEEPVNFELPGSYKEEIKLLALFDTERSMYSLWINDKLVMENKYSRISGVNAFRYVTVWCEGESFFTYTLDDFKVYHAIPPTKNILEYDNYRLTQKSILTETPVFDNYITEDLNLYTSLPFGSKVTWESDKPHVINPETGMITRAGADGADEKVTLTATVSYCGNSIQRKFEFVVLREISDYAQQKKADFEALGYGILTDKDPAHLTEALNLISRGLFGSEITWTSSNPSVIAPSGRVIRPRWTHQAQNVTVTATIGGEYQKSFDFTVIADELLKDPMKMSDEEFFGTAKKAGVLNYSLEGMAEVGAAAKNGDYNAAKEKFFERMKTRDVKAPTGLSGRKTDWVNMLICNVADMQSDGYYAAECSIDSAEYAQYSINIENPKVTTSCTKSFNLIAKYNDPVHVSIAGNDYPVESMRPYMILTVNGTQRIYPAMSAATVRAGDWSDTHYDENGELIVKMFGSFLGDETYRTIMEFNFDDIEAGDTVSGGELVIYAKKSNSYSEPKELFLLRDNNAGWNEDTVTWNTLTSYVHNFNGIEGGITWENVRKSDVEYWHQSARFDGASQLVTEYLYTKDEVYIYHIIHRIMDFIVDCKATGPNVLDVAQRMEEWVKVFNYIVQSDYMTADMATAIVKDMYMSMETIKSSSSTTANWIQSEKLNAFYIASLFPEFANSSEVSAAMIADFTEMIKKDFYADGSYVEDTVGYNALALTSYISLKESVMNAGGEMPKEYDEILRKGATAVLHMYGPAGEALGYGDSNPGGWRSANVYKNIAEWTGDHEMLYIDSFGSEGEEPSYTSIHYPDSTYTIMRSGWEKDSTYLFTSVRNGGTHNHNDDNAIIAFANGRMLLVDPGWGTYTAGDNRDYARSTAAHNSVEINGETSKTIEDNYTITTGTQGEIHSFITNESYDHLSQTSTGYTHVDNAHRRTITFIKPDFFIVSDLMTPKDKSVKNSYKQMWHMLPTANVIVDADSKKIRSNFADAASNIVIATGDSDALLKEDIGGYTVSYGNMTDVPFGYFEKLEAMGDVTFDTVLLPYKGRSGDADVNRIPLSVPTSEATAIKIKTSADGIENTTYYMLSYATPEKRMFEKYEGDGRLNVVCEDKNGNIEQIILQEGTEISDKNGNLILSTGGITVNDISAVHEEENLKIYSSDNIDIKKVKVFVSGEVKNVLFNGEYKEFFQKDGIVSVGEGDTEENLINDANQNLGILNKNESPSGGGSGGGAGGGTGTGGGNTPVTPEKEKTFFDTEGHWANTNILKMHELGYINGYEDNSFRPDEVITRAEFVSMTVRVFGLVKAEYTDVFKDVLENEWYKDDVMSALSAGIISKDTYFRPADKISREEMSKIIASALIKNGKEKPSDSVAEKYSDYKDISPWAVEYIDFISFYGFMKGRDGGAFAPRENATRAEAVTVLYRTINAE